MRGSFVFANDRGGSTDNFNNGSAVLQEGLYNASSRPSYSSSTFTTSNCRPLVNLGPPKPPPLDDIPNKIWAIFNSNRTPYRPFPHLPSGPRPPKNMGHQYPLISSIGADAPCSKTPSRPDRNPVHISLTPVSLRCAPISFRHMLLESPRAEIRQRPRHRCPGAPHRRVWIPSGLEMHNTCASSNDHPQVPDQRSGSGHWPLAVGSRSCSQRCSGGAASPCF